MTTLFALVLTFSLHAVDAHSSSCEFELLGKSASAGLRNSFGAYRAAMAEFKKSPQVLVQMAGEGTDRGIFFWSNEFDWVRMPWDMAPTDVVIGFGTNSVWDIAIRKNAKIMVVGDWAIAPLLMQEYIFRPLVTLAKNREEFLALLAGVAPTLSDSELPLEQIFAKINSLRKTESMAVRWQFLEKFIIKVEADKRFGKLYSDLLRAFFNGVMRFSTSHPVAWSLQATMYAPFPGPRGDTSVEAYDVFEWRYSPERLRREGAKPEELNDPFFSSLASPQSFERLQQLFDGNIYYVHSDFKNPEIYERALLLAKSRGLSQFTVSTTNIIDVMVDDTWVLNPQKIADKIHQKFMQTASKILLAPEAKAPVVFFQTRDWKPPHSFERHEYLPANQDVESLSHVKGLIGK